jgi:hypothetical protein
MTPLFHTRKRATVAGFVLARGLVASTAARKLDITAALRGRRVPIGLLGRTR